MTFKVIEPSDVKNEYLTYPEEMAIILTFMDNLQSLRPKLRQEEYMQFAISLRSEIDKEIDQVRDQIDDSV